MTKLLLTFVWVFWMISTFAQGNIALNKPVFASGEATPNWGHKKAHGNDGDLNSRWQGSESQGTLLSTDRYADASWWYVDLQKSYNIEGFKIFWEAAFAIAYTIDVSDNATIWKTVYQQDNSQGGDEFLLIPPTLARYVRISTTIGNMTWFPSFFEFEVYEHGKIAFDNFSLNFDHSLPAFAEFLPLPMKLYTNELKQVANQDSILVITGDALLQTTPVSETLAINFEKNYIRNFSLNPSLYLSYKAESNFIVQIDVKIGNGSFVHLDADTIFESKDLAQYWMKLALPASDLDSVLAININIRLLGRYSVSIDKIEMGKTAPAYKLQFIKPTKNQQYSEGDAVTARIGAVSGNVGFYLDNKLITEVSSVPYQTVFPAMKAGYYKLVAKLYNDKKQLTDTAYTYFAVKPKGGTLYRDSLTERLYQSLKTTASNGFPMFGMQMPTTRGMIEGSINFSYNTSDCKDIVGSHPAFHEADFSNYGGMQFRDYELFSLKEAVKRGAVVGFCWHIGGMHSGNIYVNGDKTLPDSKLVHEIVSNLDRATNPALNWLYTQLDNMAIPIFKEMGCPVIYRPWHEMTGDWFWWGSVNNPKEVAKLFEITVKYIRSQGVKNVLYAWSPNLSTDFNFYPGDEYVEILGYDAYQVGVASYALLPKFIGDLEILTDYAALHNKVVAITETGLDQSNGYPSKYADWWTQKILNPILNNPKAKRLAWIETWCNNGTFWIPYKGMTATNSSLAIADFKKFYDHPATIFENDVPDMYGFKSDNTKAFIYPHSLTLTAGQSLKIFGGTYSNWVQNENKTWSIGDTVIGTIDANGKVIAVKEGTTTIQLTVDNTITTSINLIVTKSGTTAIEPIFNDNQIMIYPNPATSAGFKVVVASEGNKTIELVDLNGNIISVVSTNNQEVFICTEKFTKGIYLVKISHNDHLIVRKVVVN